MISETVKSEAHETKFKRTVLENIAQITVIWWSWRPFTPLLPKYHLPLYKELQTFDHGETLTTLERNLRRRKVTTHSGGRTLKSTQETTRGDQEAFSYQTLRQRSKTAIFQEHLMQFRPCAEMTFGETQLNLPVRGENWDQPINQ